MRGWFRDVPGVSRIGREHASVPPSRRRVPRQQAHHAIGCPGHQEERHSFPGASGLVAPRHRDAATRSATALAIGCGDPCRKVRPIRWSPSLLAPSKHRRRALRRGPCRRDNGPVRGFRHQGSTPVDGGGGGDARVERADGSVTIVVMITATDQGTRRHRCRSGGEGGVTEDSIPLAAGLSSNPDGPGGPGLHEGTNGACYFLVRGR